MQRRQRRRRRRRDHRNGVIVLLFLALLCVSSLYINALMNLKNDRASLEMIASEQISGDPSPAIRVAERNINSVVGVITLAPMRGRFGREGEIQTYSQGSGVVIAEGGYILTNYHVIEGGTTYQILMPSGDKVDGLVVGSDELADLAVLKVSDDVATQLVPVTIGSMDSLAVGSTVIAIGNPGGEDLANTVTQGIISALERTSVNPTRFGIGSDISYIQHDAAINSGNSGGGLYNYKGELIGINTLKYSGSAYSSISFEGLGFAIPVDTAYSAAVQIIAGGNP